MKRKALAKINFNIWRKNLSNKLSNFISSPTTNFLVPLVLSFLGIYLASMGNNIAKTSLELAKNDSSQQMEIKKLNDLLIKQDLQINKQDTQIDKLVMLSAQLNKNIFLLTTQNSLTADQNRDIRRQLNSMASISLDINRQLFLGEQANSRAYHDSLLTYNTDNIKLQKSLTRIMDSLGKFNMLDFGRQYDTTYMVSDKVVSRLKEFISNIREIISEVISNKILLKDPVRYNYLMGLDNNLEHLVSRLTYYPNLPTLLEERLDIFSVIIKCFTYMRTTVYDVFFQRPPKAMPPETYNFPYF